MPNREVLWPQPSATLPGRSSLSPATRREPLCRREGERGKKKERQTLVYRNRNNNDSIVHTGSMHGGQHWPPQSMSRCNFASTLGWILYCTDPLLSFFEGPLPRKTESVRTGYVVLLEGKKSLSRIFLSLIQSSTSGRQVPTDLAAVLAAKENPLDSLVVIGTPAFSGDSV